MQLKFVGSDIISVSNPTHIFFWQYVIKFE
jgi:hypothetical protein